jgi:FemAB-related protein (PEP-CTERM system-associated)
MSFGHKAYYLLARDAVQKITGVLPLIRLKSRLFGDYMVSIPFFNYGGPCGDNLEIENVLLNAAIDIGKTEGVSHIEFRDIQKRESSIPCKTEKVSMILELPDTPDELWQFFDSKLRSQIKKPMKEGMTVETGGIEQLDNFYEVFSENMRDLGTPVYGKVFFENIFKYYPEHTKICTVKLKEAPVASGFLIGFKKRLEIPWASSLKEYNRFSPNMLLYWSVLKFAIENGYKQFDFGRSSIDSGTYKFKEQWGAKPMQLYWRYWLSNGGKLPELNPHNPKYQTAINIWKRLPLSVTKIIGPRIVKNLP